MFLGKKKNVPLIWWIYFLADDKYYVPIIYKYIQWCHKFYDALTFFYPLSAEGEPELELTKEELMALLTTVVVQAQCSHLVANIYYMTHYVFSVTEDDPLW